MHLQAEETSANLGIMCPEQHIYEIAITYILLKKCMDLIAGYFCHTTKNNHCSLSRVTKNFVSLLIDFFIENLKDMF